MSLQAEAEGQGWCYGSSCLKFLHARRGSDDCNGDHTWWCGGSRSCSKCAEWKRKHLETQLIIAKYQEPGHMHGLIAVRNVFNKTLTEHRDSHAQDSHASRVTPACMHARDSHACRVPQECMHARASHACRMHHMRNF